MPLHAKQKKDRRIQKTLRLLHEALGSLIREKPYEEIVVKEILDRANVGRSTFYMHFRDKDELLVSGIHEMLGSVHAPPEAPSSGEPYERVVRFSRPIFEHIYEHRRTGAVMMGVGGRAVVHDHLQKIVAEQISDDVGKDGHGRRRQASRIPQDLLVQYIASTFILVLNWWANSRTPPMPADADALFRTLVMPTLMAALQ